VGHFSRATREARLRVRDAFWRRLPPRAFPYPADFVDCWIDSIRHLPCLNRTTRECLGEQASAAARVSVRHLPLRLKCAALWASQGFITGASLKRNKTESGKEEILLSRWSSYDRKGGKNYEVVNGHKNEGRTLLERDVLLLSALASRLVEGTLIFIDRIRRFRGFGGLRTVPVL